MDSLRKPKKFVPATTIQRMSSQRELKRAFIKKHGHRHTQDATQLQHHKTVVTTNDDGDTIFTEVEVHELPPAKDIYAQKASRQYKPRAGGTGLIPLYIKYEDEPVDVEEIQGRLAMPPPPVNLLKLQRRNRKWRPAGSAELPDTARLKKMFGDEDAESQPNSSSRPSNPSKNDRREWWMFSNDWAKASPAFEAQSDEVIAQQKPQKKMAKTVSLGPKGPVVSQLDLSQKSKTKVPAGSPTERSIRRLNKVLIPTQFKSQFHAKKETEVKQVDYPDSPTNIEVSSNKKPIIDEPLAFQPEPASQTVPEPSEPSEPSERSERSGPRSSRRSSRSGSPNSVRAPSRAKLNTEVAYNMAHYDETGSLSPTSHVASTRLNLVPGRSSIASRYLTQTRALRGFQHELTMKRMLTETKPQLKRKESTTRKQNLAYNFDYSSNPDNRVKLPIEMEEGNDIIAGEEHLGHWNTESRGGTAVGSRPDKWFS